MKKDAFDKLYINVPPEQKEQLRAFRSDYPPRNLTVDGHDWQYIVCGQAEETLVLLPGATGNGEMAFKHITALEKEYRIISPTYPPTAATMAQLTGGIAAILDAENIQRAHIMGGSFGGIVAQCFVRKYPKIVDKLILSHTIGPKPERVKRTRRAVIILFLFPLFLIRFLFKRETTKLLDAEHGEYEFWSAYLQEEILRLNKKAIMNILKRGIDFDQHYAFKSDDLKDWPGNILIIEAADDPLARQDSSKSLKALYPRAQVYSFHGTGHAASILKPEEYRSVITNFLKES
jgi:pimeloyl-ACP methyl ester carboxylesterase